MRIGAIKEWVQPGESITFGQMRLKPMQLAILKCNRRHDVLVNLPTGFGKSVLFQYPASLLKDKCIVVFVPLKALLWDCLKEAELHSLTAAECDTVFLRKYEVHRFLPQLLFLTPQRLFQNQGVMNFIDYLNADKKIELFVIDEAHCISEWGSDFRPDYARLGEIRSLFPGTRMLGMSATIPPEALKDLISRLQITGCYYFQSSSNRPNLIYEVMSTQKPKIASSIISYIKQKQLKDESGIIYCQTIKNAEEVFKELNQYELSCCLFHSKLPQSKRERNFDGFMKGDIKCIVATICFGMGVNKKNIRYVINVGISLSAENYYQESGRAGRDGDIAFCLLLTYGSDISPLQFLINQSTKKKTLVKRKLYKLQQLKVYTKARDCRKRTLFKLLGEDFSVQDCRKTCDFCINGMSKNLAYETVDYSEKGFWIIEEMQKFKETVTKKQLISFLKGKDILKNKITKEKLKNLYQYLKDQKNQNIELLVQAMISQGLLIPYTQRIKVKRVPRYIQYLKPCTKTELMRQKPQGLQISVEVKIKNKLAQSKSEKGHISNPYITKKFDKYILKKTKSLDAPDFEVNFEKNQPRPEEDEDMKQIKMVEIGPDIEKFFDELFPENVELSKDNISDQEIGDCEDIDEIGDLQIAETSKDDIHDEEIEDRFLPITQKEVTLRQQSQQITKSFKMNEKDQRPNPKPVEIKEGEKESEDSSFDDSLFQLIKQKREQLRRKSEQEQKKDVVKRTKTVQDRDFL